MAVLCDSISHVSSRSGAVLVAQTAIYTLPYLNLHRNEEAYRQTDRQTHTHLAWTCRRQDNAESDRPYSECVLCGPDSTDRRSNNDMCEPSANCACRNPASSSTSSNHSQYTMNITSINRSKFIFWAITKNYKITCERSNGCRRSNMLIIVAA